MTARLRIIDASANRAAEALRVLEDLARFALGRADLSEQFKRLRHEVRANATALAGAAGRLTPHRDVPGDVGTAIPPPAPPRRSGLAEVAELNAARASEALRTLEEVAKLRGTDGADHLQALRYRCYTSCAALLQALGTGRPAQWRLCVLITESLCAGRQWLRVAEDAARGGADCLQLREKDLPDASLLSRATDFAALCRERTVACIINDRPDIALACGAQGVHLGQTDLPVRAVRTLAGRDLLVGVSTQDIHEARAAREAGADYCGVGPMYPTATKHKSFLAGPGYLREYLAEPGVRDVPHLAIGGISAANTRTLAEVGCRGVAVSSAVCTAPDPAAAAAAIISSLSPATA